MSLSEMEIQKQKIHTTTIIKRDGRTMTFCLDKIAAAIQKAFHAYGGDRDQNYLMHLAKQVDEQLATQNISQPTVEQVQDTVEQVLMENGHVRTAKAYMLYPFLMGEGVWIDSEKLNADDEVREVLKHGTLSVGFIGLAETLKALIGHHHGESDKAQNLGLEIVSYMRNALDVISKKRKLNFTLIATPAEGLSGRFVRMDREHYGSIKGVTDREYYTNSFHVPVYHSITMAEKIRIEAPYHALTNAGHITYVEVDGDLTNNLEAFEKIIHFMRESGIGYGSINHPIDRDTVCGYTGVIKTQCPQCGREEGDIPFERIRRITGYLVGTLDRFNSAKRHEVGDRVLHTIKD